MIGFNPANSSFSSLASLPAPRSHSDSIASNGRLLVAGGRNNQAVAQIHKDIVEYSPDEDKWYTVTDLPEQRLSPCVALFTNASGSYFFMTKGGVDWNLEVAEVRCIRLIERPIYLLFVLLLIFFSFHSIDMGCKGDFPLQLHRNYSSSSTYCNSDDFRTFGTTIHCTSNG